MLAITENTTSAYKSLKSAYQYMVGCYLFGCFGALGVGYSVYSVIAPVQYYNAAIFAVFFCASALLIGCSIDYKYQANKRIIHGINNYNNSLKNHSTISLNIGFSPTGMGLKIGF